MLPHLGSDLPAGLVVFLVALPLCLGIALSSGAPLFSGIISGIVGGVVVGYLSGSHTSVSGPAAGLTVIVLHAISSLGSFDVFLLSVLIAGLIQIILGLAKAGVIGYYFPTAVIKGMLAGIGVILLIKQLPYVFGVNDIKILEKYIPLVTGEESNLGLRDLASEFDFGALIITLISLMILMLWERPYIKKNNLLKVVPGPLLVVLMGVGINEFFQIFVPSMYLGTGAKVTLPEVESWDGFLGVFVFPDFTAIGDQEVWVVAITIAIVASLETLLSLEAADKIDPLKRISPPNRELFAQGAGNIINGLIGGLPLTAVIVRSSANVTSGAKTKMSAIFHGVLLLLTVLSIPSLLNMIPLACLAAILLLVGYKLAKISIFKTQAKLGLDQFLPFVITIIGIVIFDLLIGIGLGMGVAIVYILLRNFQNSHVLTAREHGDTSDTYRIMLSEEVSFLNKGSLMKTLDEIPNGKKVIIDGSNSKIIDYDVLEVIANFKINAKERDIEVNTIKIKSVGVGGMH